MHARSQDLGFRTSTRGFRPSMRGFRTWISGPGFQALNARFQDLDLRTWVSGPRYLALSTWVSRPRKLSILRSSYLFPVTFLCVQWSQTHARTQQVILYIRYVILNLLAPPPCDVQMFKFAITKALCFRIGKATGWGANSQNVVLNSTMALF
jgi:hypothetical protein